MDGYPGHGIKRLRERAKMTVRDLADKVGVKRATIYRLESCETFGTYETLRAVAAALDTTIPALFAPPAFLCPVLGRIQPNGVIRGVHVPAALAGGLSYSGTDTAVPVARGTAGQFGTVSHLDDDPAIVPGDIIVWEPGPAPDGALVIATGEADDSGVFDVRRLAIQEHATLLLPVSPGQQAEILRPPYRTVAVGTLLVRHLTKPR